jgi:MFS family permease
MLVVARFLQGIGAAFSSSMVLGILVNVFPKPYERARAMSVYAFVANAGGSIGLLVGGALTQALSWHWIFFVNVPIGLLSIVLAVVLIEGKEGIGIHAGVDVVGTSLVVVTPTLAIYAIVSSSSAGWGSPRTLGLLGLSVVLSGVFVVVERRVGRPLIPFSIFRSPNLRGADIVRFFHGFAMSTIFFLGALYLEDVLHMGAFTTGVAYLP